MTDDALARLSRLVRLSLRLNVVLFLMNVVLFYALLIFVVDEPATVEGVSVRASGAAAAASTVDPQEQLREFFKKTNALLERAARRHGSNPKDVCPTREEFDASVDTRTLHSPESEIVLQKLKEGYDYYNLTWPIAQPQL